MRHLVLSLPLLLGLGCSHDDDLGDRRSRVATDPDGGVGSGGCGSGLAPDGGCAPVSSCGNGVCYTDENPTSCPADCWIDPNSVCGNGFCEQGEVHATCAADCCEINPDNTCIGVCGNGFCEAGETHASCASDCCAGSGDGGIDCP